jgi:hypothetical protein
MATRWRRRPRRSRLRRVTWAYGARREVCFLRTSATGLSRHRRQVSREISDIVMLVKFGHVQGPARAHRPVCRPADPCPLSTGRPPAHCRPADPCPLSTGRPLPTVDRQTPAQVAARYDVQRSWVYKLQARYEREGEAAFEPRSRRPRTSPTAIPSATVTLITEPRATLTSAGLDAGPAGRPGGCPCPSGCSSGLRVRTRRRCGDGSARTGSTWTPVRHGSCMLRR